MSDHFWSNYSHLYLSWICFGTARCHLFIRILGLQQLGFCTNGLLQIIRMVPQFGQTCSSLLYQGSHLLRQMSKPIPPHGGIAQMGNLDSTGMVDTKFMHCPQGRLWMESVFRVFSAIDPRNKLSPIMPVASIMTVYVTCGIKLCFASFP